MMKALWESCLKHWGSWRSAAKEAKRSSLWTGCQARSETLWKGQDSDSIGCPTERRYPILREKLGEQQAVEAAL